MAKNMATNELSKPIVHTKLTVMLAVFKANKLVELLATLNMTLLLLAVVYASSLMVKGTAVFGVIAGMAVFYYSLRIRIDQVLFERWDSLDIQALDAALMQLNAHYEAGKTLNQRLTGAYQLFKMGLYGLIMQFIVLLIVAWILVPKVLS